MESYNELLQAVFDMITSMPAVMTFFDNDPARIEIFAEQFPESTWLPARIQQMNDPGVLIVHEGVELGERGGMTQWRHNISIYVRLPGENNTGYGPFLKTLMTTPIYPDGLNLLNSEISSACDPMEFVSFTRQNEPAKLWHYHRLALSLQEKGGAGI